MLTVKVLLLPGNTMANSPCQESPEIQTVMPTTDTEFSRLKHWWPRVAIALGLLWVALFLVKLGSGLWLDHQRGQLEQEITRATGYTTRIQGPVTATLFPSPGFALADVTLSRDGKPLVTAKEFQSSFELLPLLAGKFVPHAIHIYGIDRKTECSDKDYG